MPALAAMSSTAEAKLSRSILERRERVLRDRDIQVHALSSAGERYCLAGRKSGTFDACKKVKDILAGYWVKILDPPVAGRSWAPSSPPTSIVFPNGLLAGPEDPIGLFGDIVTVVWSEVELSWEDKPCADLSGIQTPPTPK